MEGCKPKFRPLATSTDPWSISHLISGRPWLAGKQLPLGLNEMDLGSGIMSRHLESYGINILQLHVEWLLANGYKQQAASCKRQIRMILKNKKNLNIDNKVKHHYIG